MQFLKRTASALALAGATFASQAAPVTYDFSVAVLSGPLGPSTLSGWLSFDSSAINPNNAVNQTGLLTGFSFSLDGTLYNQTTANTGFLEFDGAGALIDFAIGSSCLAGDNCSVNAGANGFVLHGGSLVYATSAAGYDLTYSGLVTDLTLRGGGGAGGGNVPEPASLALVLSAALLAYGSTRRRA